MASRSNSSVRSLSVQLKVAEAARLIWRLSRGGERQRDQFLTFQADVAEYGRAFEAHAGTSFRKLSIFEIGYGQRPYRLFCLQAHGHDVRGIDLDEPMLRPSLRKTVAILRRNGYERALKTLVRKSVFDRSEWRAYCRRLDELVPGGKFETDEARLLVDDVANLGRYVEPGSIDFIYSEDVFEHIDAASLPVVCEAMRRALRPNGVAFVRPMVFTGIMGGHNVEWYDAGTVRSRRCPPWDHLRGQRFSANTFLNRLGRREYVELFKRHFVILDEQVLVPDLGREYMTPAIRAELAGYDDYELFSNWVRFVMKPKPI